MRKNKSFRQLSNPDTSKSIENTDVVPKVTIRASLRWNPERKGAHLIANPDGHFWVETTQPSIVTGDRIDDFVEATFVEPFHPDTIKPKNQSGDI